MKTSFLRIIGVIGLGLAGGLATAQAVESVLSPTKRQEMLDMGKALVATREITPVTANPFSPPAFAEVVAALGRSPTTTTPSDDGARAPVAGPRTDRDILQAIAASLKPSGYILLGNQPSLSFGQKRVKPNGTLTITFEGNQYTLEIVSIDRTKFTLRLNREEFTRTIK